jgi:hypothetical protein
MNAKERRAKGAHYTTEKNILKVIEPLFLDDLRAEFEKIRSNRNKLHDFHEKLAALKFLDPACGCGNFLVVAYRELRLLELEVILAFNEKDLAAGQINDPRLLIKCNVDQFFGIEIEEFPAQIAQVALWLTDHQMNLRVQDAFGNRFVRLPLEKSAGIVHDNALRIDWNDVVPAKELSFILGNPPFVGKKEQNLEQKRDMASVFSGVDGAGVLDFVCAWYFLASKYVGDNKIRVAYVSTSSIVQGEQVSILWSELYKIGMQINFAHRTFKWSNEARGKAAVHCVIIGISRVNSENPVIYEYADFDGEPHRVSVGAINSYLVDAPEVIISNRKNPICDVPEMSYGSFALDDGNYTLDEMQKNEIISASEAAKKYLRPFIGGQEFLHGQPRWCLWLKDALPQEIKSIAPIMERVESVRKWRSMSSRENTKKLSETPTLFAEIRQPSSTYVAIPTVSSEKRLYIPVGFLLKETIASNQLYLISGAGLFHMGVVQSVMHMAWVRAVCGRLESRYRYSAGIVYNNFPWPEPTDKQRETIEQAAQGVLDARAQFPDATLADLYDPLTMPPELVKAHHALDRAVDAAYGKRTFKSDAERVAFLFERYQQLTSLLPAATQKAPRKRKAKADADGGS